MTVATKINTNLCEVLDLAIETFPDEEHWTTGALYSVRNSGYCALGWIGHCMGYTDEQLVHGPNLDDPAELYDELFLPLGLDRDDRGNIYYSNDLGGRQKAISAVRAVLNRKCSS